MSGPRAIAPLLGFALGAFALAAERPPTPEPKVVATIDKPAKPGGTCFVSAEIRDPESNRVLAAPNLAVKAGEQANVSTSESDRKIEVTLRAGAGCAGGTYDVNVWTRGKLQYGKSGPCSRRPRSPAPCRGMLR